MSSPAVGWTFVQRLDWLLATVPCTPGSDRRFSAHHLVRALAAVAPGDRSPAESSRMARRWLADIRVAGATIPNDWASGRFIAAIEDIFRLPLGYFRDAGIAAATDARITFARDTHVDRLRIVGPCRLMRSEFSVERLHAAHLEVAVALRQQRLGP